MVATLTCAAVCGAKGVFLVPVKGDYVALLLAVGNPSSLISREFETVGTRYLPLKKTHYSECHKEDCFFQGQSMCCQSLVDSKRSHCSLINQVRPHYS